MKRILFFIVFLAALFLGIGLWEISQNRANLISEKVESAKTAEHFQESQNKIAQKGNKQISFKNVSFIYNSDLFTDVKGEMVPALPLDSPTDKPDSVYPEHINFVFTNPYSGEEILGDEYYSKVRIHVYQVEENKKSTSDNLFVKFTNRDFKELKQVIAKKSQIPLSSDKQLPYIPFADAHQAFYARAKIVNFQDGKGLLFLTQWQQDEVLINNERLEYVFQGLTSDNKHFVFMEFSIAAKNLPDNDGAKYPRKYEALNNTADFLSERYQQLYKKYARETAINLDKMPSEDFSPNLDKIEDLIGSLNVK